ncbi:MAG: PfkB family carbohydrate kinase [Geminicoccales bacterium]
MIGVIGNAVLDLSFEVPTLPRSGETIIASAPEVDTGGKGLNQAIVSHRAGSQVRLAAVIGNDTHGKLIEKQIMDDGM